MEGIKQEKPGVEADMQFSLGTWSVRWQRTRKCQAMWKWKRCSVDTLKVSTKAEVQSTVGGLNNRLFLSVDKDGENKRTVMHPDEDKSNFVTTMLRKPSVVLGCYSVKSKCVWMVFSMGHTWNCQADIRPVRLSSPLSHKSPHRSWTRHTQSPCPKLIPDFPFSLTLMNLYPDLFFPPPLPCFCCLTYLEWSFSPCAVSILPLDATYAFNQL